MREFLRFYDSISKKIGLELDIRHSITGWVIGVSYNAIHPTKHYEPIFSIQENDMELVFARAQVILKKWLQENEDVY